MLSNRLKKNLARRRPPHTDCFRLYDRDIPEIPLVIDVYGDRIRVQEMPGRHARTDEAHAAYLQTLLDEIAEVTNCARERIVLRRRVRRRKGEQHRRSGHDGERFWVHEHGLQFAVNLTD